MRQIFRVAALALLAATITTPHVLRATPSPNVVISEFRVRGPNGAADEFVELYNKSAAAVSIGSWKLNGSNNAGTVSTRVSIAAGTILNPGCHYLLTNSSTSGGPYSGTVAGNQTYATGITDDGGLALLTATNVVVDQVGMSSGSAYKEGTTLASLGASNLNRGYERKPGGGAGSGTDTDDNGSDFQLVTPSDPQNASSPCIDVAGPTGIGAATPASVGAGATTLLTVAVTKGTGGLNSITSVAGNLTAIGGSASQLFFDDGSHGDATANDLTYSYLATVAVGTSEGAKSLPATITDAQGRTGSATIALMVAAPPPPFVEIHTIQGSGAGSPYAGQAVSTEGIVTARRFNNGFFIQQPDAQMDVDPATSEGLFVFTGSIPPAAAVGNFVSVVGTVAEFIPSADPFSPSQTEMSNVVSVTVQSTGNPLPQAVTLSAADVSPTGPFDQMERFEGMRVAVPSLTVVAPTQGTVSEANATSSSTGVYYGVVSGVPRPMREPGIQVPDPLPAGAPCCVPRFDANPELLRVDSNGQAEFLATQTTEVMAGAIVTGIVGVVDYNSRAYTILPDVGAQGVVTNTHGAIAVTAPRADQFTIGTANVERFFDTINDDSVSDVKLTQEAFAMRLNKVSLQIRNIMRTPDIVGFEEVENLTTLQAIAAKVNADAVANGDANPQYVGYLEEGNDPGGIDVGFLVKSSRVTVVDVVQYGKDEMYVNPLNHQPELLNDRPPLVLRATIHTGVYDDANVTVIANHLRSLNGIDDPVDGPRVRAKRLAQAEYLARLIQDRQNERVVAVGDFNAFEFNDGYADLINTIRGDAPPADHVVTASLAGDLVEPNLTDLVSQATPPDRYSYVFAGSAQELDHVLVNQPALAIVDAVEWGRVNADFPETLRGDATRPERVSDHDPMVAYFRLLDQTPPAAPTLTVSRSALWPPNHQMIDIVVTATTTDAVDQNPVCGIVGATSSEPDNGDGDGDTANDIVLTGPLTLALRAERSGGGTGRIYSVLVACQDHATPPNVSQPSTVTVSVPKRR